MLPKKAITATLTGLLCIGLAACGNTTTTTTTPKNSNNTSKQAEPKVKTSEVNPQDWKAWNIKMTPTDEVVPNGSKKMDGSPTGQMKRKVKWTFTNLSNKTVYSIGALAYSVVPDKGSWLSWVASSSAGYTMINGIDTDVTNFKPGETKSFDGWIADTGEGTGATTVILTKLHIFDTKEDVISYVFPQTKEGDNEEYKNEKEAYEKRACPDGIYSKTDQCEEQFGPVFDAKTGKKIKDQANATDNRDEWPDLPANATTENWQELEWVASAP